MTSDDWIKFFPSVVTSITALAGTILAVRGVNRWRKEMLGKYEVETVRKLLRSLIHFERVINSVRVVFNPEKPEEYFKKLNDAFAEFESALIDARVQWGVGELKEQSLAIIQCFLKVRHAMNVLRRAKVDPRRSTTEAQIMRIEKAEDILFGDGEDEDAFDKEIKSAVEDFEHALRKRLPTKPAESFLAVIESRLKQMRETMNGDDTEA